MKSHDEFDALRKLSEVLFSPPAAAPIQAFPPEIAFLRTEGEEQTVVKVIPGGRRWSLPDLLSRVPASKR